MDFYERLAPWYHLIYPDWEASVAHQGEVLDRLLFEALGRRGTLLDAACGVGTQALGLAGRGWQVTASDLAAGAVERLRSEAAARDLEIDTSVADLRRVADHHGRRFDAVIACDNALPHLLTDDDLLAALRQLHAATEPGGLCVLSVRDYDALRTTGQLDGPTIHPRAVHVADATRRSVFQVWEPTNHPDGRLTYTLTMYLVEDSGGPQPTTHAVRSEYHAVGIDRLLVLMEEAGFRECRRIDEVFFQPLLTGRA